MRFLGGLTVEETAVVLRISPVTVRREWSAAKIWLYREPTGQRPFNVNQWVDGAGLTPAHRDPALSCQEPMRGAPDRVHADDVTLGIDTQGRGG